VRCVIADDDQVFLEAARAVMEQGGVTVAGVAMTSAGAIAAVEALRPDVVLIDICLGLESGFDAARALAVGGHAAALIMISTHARDDYADLIADSPAAGSCPRWSCRPRESAGSSPRAESHRGYRQAMIIQGDSIRVVSVFRNRAARAPSMTRWSEDRVYRIL
jgi:chemotaxis response regulator CheB